MKLQSVPVKFPASWGQFSQEVERRLKVEPHEDGEFVQVPTTVWLPKVLVVDYAAAAEQLQWSLGQLLGYLALHGAVSVTRSKGGRL